MSDIINSMLSWVYIVNEETGDPEYFKSFLAFICFAFVFYIILEFAYIIRGTTNILK